MCGIIGYVGKREGGRPVQELLLDGLKKLEYRGYDSAGISVIGEDRIETVRAVGNLDALRAKLDGATITGAVLTEAQRTAMTSQIPLARAGTDRDIAAAVAFLASEEAGYITGQQINVNGGWYV